MKLYKVSRTGIIGYDEFDSMVVCAESKEEAKNMHPECKKEVWHKWGEWVNKEEARKLIVEELGTSNEETKRVILSSFIAG
jgi:hypothetical protein